MSEPTRQKIRWFFRGRNKIALAKAVINDPRFREHDFAAAGLLMALASLSDRGHFAFDDVVNLGGGPHKTRRYLRALIDLGYIRLLPKTVGGHAFVDVRYAVNRYIDMPPAPGGPRTAAKPRAKKHRGKLPPQEKGVVWIYAIAAGDAVKIGGSANVEQRIKRLQDTRSIALKFLFAYAVPKSHSATVERRVHIQLSRRQLDGEWFLCPPADAEDVLKRVIASVDIPARRFPESK
jgi:hypothetical protein